MSHVFSYHHLILSCALFCFAAHFSARLVNGPAHAEELAGWVAKHGIKQVFIIGGDVDTPKHYPDALPFMKDFLASKPGVHTVGNI
jgi:hypothetical protein